MHKLTSVLLVLGTGATFTSQICLGAPKAVHVQSDPMRVIYQLDGDNKDTTTALHQIKNQLTADPASKIIVLAIGKSVRFVVRGSKTEGGYPYALMIEDLQQMGARIEVCGTTMHALRIDPKQLDDGVEVVPTGMAELARRQWRDGYVYIKP